MELKVNSSEHCKNLTFQRKESVRPTSRSNTKSQGRNYGAKVAFRQEKILARFKESETFREMIKDLSEFVVIVSILYYKFIEFIILLYTFLVIFLLNTKNI